MQLTHIRIRNFRCLSEVVLEPDGHINLIAGDNGSGKSSLLEAIYFLGRARSFRSGTSDQMITRGSSELSVFARITSQAGHTTAGILRQPGHTRLQLGGDPHARLLDLVKTLPIQLVDPGIHRLSEEGPGQRRRFMDWGVFHVEPQFYLAWQRYRRALRQRNKALKSRYPRDMAPIWDNELVTAGLQLDSFRRKHVKALNEIMEHQAESLPGQPEVKLRYNQGWNKDLTFAEAVHSSLEQDIDSGFTRTGPHRADLRMNIGATIIKQRASRGEQKALTILLSLAQASHIYASTGIKPILLIDDLAAELGTGLRNQVAQTIAQLGVQCFVTLLDQDLVPEALSKGSMFHVEQGGIFPMV